MIYSLELLPNHYMLLFIEYMLREKALNKIQTFIYLRWLAYFECYINILIIFIGTYLLNYNLLIIIIILLLGPL